jgi:hypothetical protein
MSWRSAGAVRSPGEESRTAVARARGARGARAGGAAPFAPAAASPQPAPRTSSRGSLSGGRRRRRRRSLRRDARRRSSTPPSRPWISASPGRQVGTRSDHEGGSGKVEATCCDGNKLFLLAYNRSGRRRTAGLRLAQPCSLDDARIAARRPPAAGRGGGVRRRRSLGGFGDNSGRSHASPRWS